MRIGLFTDTYPPDINGVANSTYILREELVKLGHEVYVICPKKGLGWAEWNEDHTILGLAGIQLKQLYGYVMTSPFHANALNEIKELHLDVIHSQQEFGVGIFARICARQLDIPLVTTFHTDYEDYTHYVNLTNSEAVDHKAKQAIGYLARVYGNGATKVIAPSEKTKNVLLKYGVSPDIFVVPTGLHLEQFDPKKKDEKRIQSIRNQYRILEGELLAVSVGRIAQEKSLDVVIDGFTKAVKEGVPCKLLIVGGGPDLEKLQQQAKEEGMENAILFSGPVPAEEVKHYYHCGNFFVSASLSETQGMTFIEAMASGLPLYCRYDSVLDGLLVEGTNGAFYSDSDDLCVKLKELASYSEQQWKTMSMESLKLVEPMRAEIFAQKVLNVYQNAIETHENMLVIVDVQAKDEIVQLYLSDAKKKKEDIRVVVPIDVYYSEGLRKGMHLSKSAVEQMQANEAATRAYESCIRKISLKDRTRKEMYDWLTRETDCDIESINSIIDKLEMRGYIDDERYCKEAVIRMKQTLMGEERIIRDLRKKGIPQTMTESVLRSLPEDEETNAMRYVTKCALTIHDVSVPQKKKKLMERMLSKGYDSELSRKIINEMDFSEDKREEINVLRKVALKAKKRYERNYSGTKLRNTVYRYCASQGFQAEDIYTILDELEWDNNND